MAHHVGDRLQETGSSLLYPLFNLWTQAIEKAWPAVSITTASTGSGTGVASAAAGTVNIGASDAYLSPAQVQQYPALANIPVAISGQEINYNVPGLTGHLKLERPGHLGHLPGPDHQLERPQDRRRSTRA